MTLFQFSLGQSVSAAFSVSFVCSCCKHVCDYVTYLSISFINHAAVAQSSSNYRRQQLQKISFLLFHLTTYLLFQSTPKAKT